MAYDFDGQCRRIDLYLRAEFKHKYKDLTIKDKEKSITAPADLFGQSAGVIRTVLK